MKISKKILNFKKEKKMEELKARKSQLLEQLKVAKKKVDKSRNIFHYHEEKFYKIKKEFEAVDRELAMIDGRYRIEAPATNGKKVVVDAGSLLLNLSKSQLARIAATLGFEIELGGEE